MKLVLFDTHDPDTSLLRDRRTQGSHLRHLAQVCVHAMHKYAHGTGPHNCLPATRLRLYAPAFISWLIGCS
eukprot:1820656-Amphidinium_carterae.1